LAQRVGRVVVRKGAILTLKDEIAKYLQVVLEFEGLFALGAFEFAKNCTLVVANHVSLQSVHVGKLLVAHFARLKQQQHSSVASKKFTHNATCRRDFELPNIRH
jgi:hypothetical protein